jgi:acyl carrier protein
VIDESVDRTADRRDFVECLQSAGVIGLARHAEREKFIVNTRDIPYDELHIDSLTRVEMAISIEARYDVSLSPVQISELHSLGELFELIMAKTNR